MQRLTDEQLKAKTAEFRQRLKAGAQLDDLLVEAFAVVREVSSRVLRLRHFDAQLVSSCKSGKPALFCVYSASSVLPCLTLPYPAFVLHYPVSFCLTLYSALPCQTLPCSALPCSTYIDAELVSSCNPGLLCAILYYAL